MIEKTRPEVIETQTFRETQLIEIVKNISPGLVLHSRKAEGVLRASLSRLRFDKPIKLIWLLRMFSDCRDSEIAPLAFTIVGAGHKELYLENSWIDIEIHVYESKFLSKAKLIASKYIELTGKKASIVLNPIVKKSIWRPIINFGLIVFAVSLIIIAVRLLSIFFINQLLQWLGML